MGRFRECRLDFPLPAAPAQFEPRLPKQPVPHCVPQQCRNHQHDKEGQNVPQTINCVVTHRASIPEMPNHEAVTTLPDGFPAARGVSVPYPAAERLPLSNAQEAPYRYDRR